MEDEGRIIKRVCGGGGVWAFYSIFKPIKSVIHDVTEVQRSLEVICTCLSCLHRYVHSLKLSLDSKIKTI